ncbi:MAG TPA: DUF2062 domain-containing protein [Labilithrix sp.]
MTRAEAPLRARRRALRASAKTAWKRLRGGELTPARAAASVAIGLAIGVTPLWGAHWLLVIAICVPLKLDAGVAFLASNISLPFIAPFITFAEIEVGARVLGGTWLALRVDDVKAMHLSDVLAELALGTVLVAIGSAAAGGAAAWALVARRRR